MTSSRSRAPRTAVFGAFVVLFVTATLIGRATHPEDSQVALAWPAAGAGVWFLAWTRGRSETTAALAAILLGALLVNLGTGLPVAAAVAFAVCNTVHSVAGTLLLRRLLPGGRGLDDPGDVLRLLLVGLGAGAVSGLLSATAAAGLLDQPFWGALLLFVVRNAGTTFVVLATVLSLSGRHRLTELVRGHRVGELVLGAAASLGVYVVVFVWNPPRLPILFLALSTSVWAGTRLGVARTGALGMLLSVVAISATVTGHGTLSGVADHQMRAVLAQAFTVLVLVVGLVLATLQESRDEIAARLAASLAQLQRVSDSALISKVVALRDAEGWTLTQPNPALVQLLGRDPSGVRWDALLHPDDSAEVRAAADSLAVGDAVAWDGEVRHRQPGGGWLWTHLHVSGLPSLDGTTAVVAQLLDITGRRASQDELLRRAHHDSLTGLPNRSRLHDELDRLLREQAPERVAVLFLDLDAFKGVNDTYGHAAGDRVLVQVGRALEQALRPGDLVSRLGGDEFVVCCPGVVDLEQGRSVVRRIVDAVRPALLLDGVDVGLDVSVGLSVSHDGQDAGEVLRRSDEAMYASKQRRRSSVASA